MLKQGGNTSIICSLLVVVGVAFVCDMSTAADWPRYRGPNQDGVTSEGIDRWPPVELWRADLGKGFSQVSVVGGKVYSAGWSSASSEETIFCFDENSSGNNPTPLWTYSYSTGSVAYEGTRATPTVDGNSVYMLSAKGRVVCVNKDTGAYVWDQTPTGDPPNGLTSWGYGSSPLIEGNLVIVNMGGRGLALDKNTGAFQWRGSGETASDPAGYASPIAFTRGTQRTVVIFDGDEVLGVDPADGTTLWSFPWSTSYNCHAADPILYNDKVWISSGYGSGNAVISLGSGALTADWTDTTMRNKENCSVLYNGYVYGISEGSGLRCVEFATGNTVWTQGGFGTESAVSIANGELVIADSTGNDIVVATATPTGYSEQHRLSSVVSGRFWTAPIVANGKLYVRGQSDVLIAYDVSSASPTVSITLDTNLTGRTISVDGTAYTAPQTFPWTVGATHTINATSPQGGAAGTRYAFASWSDGGAQSHTYTVPAAAETVTATFNTEYELITDAQPSVGGTVSPAGATWHSDGTVVSVTATPNSGYTFVDWTGDLTGVTNPGTVTMTGPMSVTGNFTNILDTTPPVITFQSVLLLEGSLNDPTVSTVTVTGVGPIAVVGRQFSVSWNVTTTTTINVAATDSAGNSQTRTLSIP